jgi:hypothetical protein
MSSSYDKFLSFEDIAMKRLGKDVTAMVFKAMNFTRAELRENYEMEKSRIGDLEIDRSTNLKFLTEKIYDAKRDLDIVAGISKLQPEDQAYKTLQSKVEAAQQEFRDARAWWSEQINVHKQRAQRVKEDHNSL